MDFIERAAYRSQRMINENYSTHFVRAKVDQYSNAKPQINILFSAGIMHLMRWKQGIRIKPLIAPENNENYLGFTNSDTGYKLMPYSYPEEIYQEAYNADEIYPSYISFRVYPDEPWYLDLKSWTHNEDLPFVKVGSSNTNLNTHVLVVHFEKAIEQYNRISDE